MAVSAYSYCDYSRTSTNFPTYTITYSTTIGDAPVTTKQQLKDARRKVRELEKRHAAEKREARAARKAAARVEADRKMALKTLRRIAADEKQVGPARIRAAERLLER